MIRSILFLFFVLTALFSCKKEVITSKTEENTQEYILDTIIVSGNIPPSDTGASQMLVDAFIQKTYITLLGRKANDAEFIVASSLVSPAQFSVSNRKLVIDLAMSNINEYRSKIYTQFSEQILQNTDSNDINVQIATMDFILSNSAMQEYWTYAQNEKNRLENLKNTYYQYTQAQTSLSNVHKTLINNGFYDEINMGTSNFVTSSFLHFLNRYPTNSELTESSLMVDGFSGVLFFETGYSKNDYVNIFFNSDHYYEGQVASAFYTYLRRNPSITELSKYTLSYQDTQDFEALIKELLSTNEFAGLQ
jgi:hypothetical protein